MAIEYIPKFIGVIDSLNLPANWKEVIPNEEYHGKKLVFGKTKKNLLDVITQLEQFGLKLTCKHTQEVAIGCYDLANYLKFGEFEEDRKQTISSRGSATQALVTSAIYHDAGKMHSSLIKIAKASEKAQKEGTTFPRESYNILKSHTMRSGELAGDSFTKGIIIRHHKYQENPYPFIPFIFYSEREFGERGAEVNYLSKLFSLVDCEKLLSLGIKSGVNDKDLPFDILISRYGKMDFSYNGDKLPKVRVSGMKLIEQLYNNGIFKE